MSTKLLIKLILMAAISSFSTANANDEELSFDEFISQFDQNRYKRRSKSRDPFENILIHLGVGYVSSILNIEVPISYTTDGYVLKETGETVSAEEAFDEETDTLKDTVEEAKLPAYSEDKFQSFQSGFQLSLGIDLFSRYWSAEGSIRNFSSSKANQRQAELKEFDLKIVFKKHLFDSVGYRAGGGLGARYLTFTDFRKSFRQEYSTPTSILFFGLQSHVSEKVSLGAELATRGAMLSEAPDKSTYDLTLRVDAHF